VNTAEKNQEIDRLALALHAACATIQGLADELSEACAHPAAGDLMLADILSAHNLRATGGGRRQ